MSGSVFGHRDWYNAIATRNGGYRKTWSSRIEGQSGEEVFRHLLFDLLEPHMEVLDAGCGSAEFSIEVARRVRSITGLDYAENMIRQAKENATNAGIDNSIFTTGSTYDMQFEEESFDLAYSRRGPTSILLHSQLLRPGSWMLGVHSSGADVIHERLAGSGLENVEIDEYEALEIIPTWRDFTEYWSRMPGHPDYSDDSKARELADLAGHYRHGEQFAVPHHRIVWKARRLR